MATDFSTVFAKLRHEKGISQREAASDLGVSQALLSHYENGVREPRLEFVSRACAYYGVSADYLLGRTNVRENPCTMDSGLPTPGAGDFSVWEDEGVSCLLNVLAAALKMLFSACGKEAVGRGSLYIRTAIYKLFRYTELRDWPPDSETGELPDFRFRSLCDATMSLTESALALEIRSAVKDGAIEDFCDDLKAAAPAIYKKFMNMMRQTEEEINRLVCRG